MLVRKKPTIYQTKLSRCFRISRCCRHRCGNVKACREHRLPQTNGGRKRRGAAPVAAACPRPCLYLRQGATFPRPRPPPFPARKLPTQSIICSLHLKLIMGIYFVIHIRCKKKRRHKKTKRKFFSSKHMSQRLLVNRHDFHFLLNRDFRSWLFL